MARPRRKRSDGDEHDRLSDEEKERLEDARFDRLQVEVLAMRRIEPRRAR